MSIIWYELNEKRRLFSSDLVGFETLLKMSSTRFQMNNNWKINKSALSLDACTAPGSSTVLFPHRVASASIINSVSNHQTVLPCRRVARCTSSGSTSTTPTPSHSSRITIRCKMCQMLCAAMMLANLHKKNQWIAWSASDYTHRITLKPWRPPPLITSARRSLWPPFASFTED